AAECAAIDQETLDLALRLDAPVAALRSRARLAFDSWALGQPGPAATHAEEYSQLSRGFRHPRFRWPVPMFRAMRALFEGRFDEQEQPLAEAGPLLASIEGDIGRYGLSAHRMMASRTRGDDAAAHQFLRAFGSIAGGPYAALGGVMQAVGSGRLAEAGQDLN